MNNFFQLICFLKITHTYIYSPSCQVAVQKFFENLFMVPIKLLLLLTVKFYQYTQSFNDQLQFKKLRECLNTY